MKTCIKCQKQFDENLTYCPFCGAENADKKLTYFEKKQARDKDTEFILSKASIQNADEESAKSGSPEDLVLEKFQSFKKSKLFSILRFSVSLLFAIACLVVAWITVNREIDGNLKLVVIFAAFIAIAVCASVFISDIYSFIYLRKFADGDFSLRKIYFTKGPILKHGDDLYEIKTYKACEDCNSKMHLELKDDDLYFVCDANRSHLYKIDKNTYIEYFKDKLSK